jgi:hypothetical protein
VIVSAEPIFTIALERPSEMLMATYKNVNIIVWYAAASGEAVEMLDEATVARVRDCPSGISAIHVASHTAGLPSAEARDGLVRSSKRWSAHLACVAVVIERKGFWASAMRGAVTGIQMLAPRSFVSQVHDSIEQATEWLPPHHSKRTGVQLEAAELLSVVRRVRDSRMPNSQYPTSAA